MRKKKDGGVWPSTLMHAESPGSLDSYNVLNNLLKIEVDKSALQPIQVVQGEGCLFDLILPPTTSNWDALAGDERLTHDKYFTGLLLLQEAQRNNEKIDWNK